MTAADLIHALEQGHSIRKILNPEMSKPQHIDLYFVWWEAGATRVLYVTSNYPIRPSSLSDKRHWLCEAIERPDEWRIIEKEQAGDADTG